MKKMRKVLSLIIALAFLFSVVAPAMAAETTAQEKAGTRLLELGIIAGDTGGDLLLDKTLTRAEVAVLLARLNGMGDAAELLQNQPSKFTDVKTGEWYTGWINLASSQGWIKGDPQGTFRPNDAVQYREAITMITKVLGYNDNLVGVWPTNYLAKATSLGITKGLSYTDAKTPAVRGDIFLVSSRALDEKVVYWSASENEFLYKESKSGSKISNITLLENALNLVKYEEMFVTDIPMINSSLKANQVKLNGGKTYTLKVGKPLDYFGKEVTVWVDDNDKEIWAIQIDTDDSDIYMDTLTSDTTSSKVALDVADKKIDIADDAAVYVNGKSVDETKLASYEGAYGRFVLNEEGDVAYALLFDFDGDQGVAISVKDKVVTYVDDAASKDDNELDLEDYDDGYYVFDQDLNEIDLSTVAKNSALFYGENSDDDIAYVLVSSKTVTGKLERLSADKAKIGDTTYDLAKVSGTVRAIYSDNSGSDYSQYALDDAEGLIGYDVLAVLNLSGDVLLLTGASNETSGTLYGVVTYAEKAGSSKVTVFNKEGKEVEYKFADRGDLVPDISQNNSTFDYYGKAGTLKYALIKYKLDNSSEIYSDFKTDTKNNGTIVTVATSTPSDATNKPAVAFGDAAKVKSGVATKKADKDYVEISGDKYYFDESTVIMATIDKDELDPALMKYDTLYSNAVTANSYAVVFGEAGKTAGAIFFVEQGFDGADDDLFYGVVAANPVKDGDNWYADIDIAGEAKKEIKLDSNANLYKGSLIGYKVNNSGKAVYQDTFNVNKKIADYSNADSGEIIANVASGATFPSDLKNAFVGVTKVDGYTLTIGTTNYKVDSNVVVYALDKDDSYAVDKKSTYSKVNENDGVVLLLNEDSKVAGILLVDDLFKGTPSTPPVTTGVVTFEDTGNKVLYVDNTPYVLNASTLLKTAKGSVIAAGDVAIFVALAQNDKVADIVVKDGVVTSLVGTAVASVQTAAVTNLIATLNSNELNPAHADFNKNGNDVTNARAAYNALLPAQRDFVTNYAKLTAAEEALASADAVNVAADKAALAIAGDLNNVTANLTLATAGAKGSTITWASSNTTLVKDSTGGTLGAVTRPTFTVGDTVVTLTATITSGTVSDTKVFTVTVKAAAPTDAEKVVADKAALTIAGDLNNVTGNLTLAIAGANGTTITWVSSNTTLVNDSTGGTLGAVTRPSGANVQVTLTATIKAGSESATKVFYVTVLGE